VSGGGEQVVQPELRSSPVSRHLLMNVTAAYSNELFIEWVQVCIFSFSSPK
jgi:hypothetical protein